MSTSVVSNSSGTNGFDQAFGKMGNDDLGKEDFLKLLVTQFQHQDPLNPMEDKEFIAQLAQFSSLEQLMNLNESMGGLTQATSENQLLNATSFIGKTVTAEGRTISKQEGVPITTFEYAFGDTIVAGEINVYDSNDQLVYTETLGTKAGYPVTHDFDWNGKDSASGGVAPDGIYTVHVGGRNSAGETVQVDTQVEGIVDGVFTENGMIGLSLHDGRNIALMDVRQVSELNTTLAKKLDDAKKEIETELAKSKSWAATALEDKTHTAAEVYTELEKRYETAKKAVDEWAEKEKDDETGFVGQVKTMFESMYKEFNDTYKPEPATT